MGRMRCYSWERAVSSTGGACDRYWLMAAVRLRVEIVCSLLWSSQRSREYFNIQFNIQHILHDDLHLLVVSGVLIATVIAIVTAIAIS